MAAVDELVTHLRPSLTHVHRLVTHVPVPAFANASACHKPLLTHLCH